MVEQRYVLQVVFWKYLFISGCYGGIIKFEVQGERGQINSPNYPSSYPLNFTSRWTIRGPERARIQLNFTDFSIEKNKKCLYDYLIIGDDTGTWSSKYCGDKLPPGYVSFNRHLYIKFVSDRTTSSRGFRAKWQTILAKEDRSATPTSSPSLNPARCSRLTTITLTQPSCTQSSSTTQQPLKPSCICSPTTITSSKVHNASSYSISTSSKKSSSASIHLPVRFLNKVTLNDIIQNNTLHINCSPRKQDDEKEAKRIKNQNLVIVLGALVATFFLIDILLIFLWCRLHKRGRRDNQRQCPPIELKVIDGKVVASARPKLPRITLVDSSMEETHRPHYQHRRDGNDNIRKANERGILKGKKSTPSRERLKLVSSEHML